MSETHEEGLAMLRYGIMAGKGFLLLTGEVGTGKTTLLQTLVNDLPGNVHCCLLNNPTLSRDEFFAYLSHQFGLGEVRDKAMFLVSFGRFLSQCREREKRVLLIVDEAHVMPEDLLEEIRLISNQDASGGAVLSIFLVGQPELDTHLATDRLRPLRQRIGIRFPLERFDRETTRQYILFRLRSAGATNLELFSAGAMDLIHRVSQGTPRLINILCDHALLSGFADNAVRIDEAIIRECVADLHLDRENRADNGTAKDGQAGPFHRWWLLILFLVPVLLVLVEMVPATRPWSPLALIVPDQWIQWLDQFLQ